MYLQTIWVHVIIFCFTIVSKGWGLVGIEAWPHLDAAPRWHIVVGIEWPAALSSAFLLCTVFFVNDILTDDVCSKVTNLIDRIKYDGFICTWLVHASVLATIYGMAFTRGSIRSYIYIGPTRMHYAMCLRNESGYETSSCGHIALATFYLCRKEY